MELKERYFVLVDTETTGFDSEKHQILEVGMLVIKDMKCIGELRVGIKHKEYLLTAGAMEANNINIIEHEKTALWPKEACETIIKFLEEKVAIDDDGKGAIFLGQNVQFDIKFMEKLFLSNYMIKDYRKYISYRNLDIMQLAMIRNLEGKINLNSQSLDSIVKALEIDPSEVIPDNMGQRHSALYDCYLELEVFKKLLNL